MAIRQTRWLREHEQHAFEDIYLDFLKDYQENFRCSFLTLSNLAKAATYIHNNEAFNCLNSLIVRNEQELDLKRRYFKKISEEIGGKAALDFLKIETYFKILFVREYAADPIAISDPYTVASLGSIKTGEHITLADGFPNPLATKWNRLLLNYESENLPNLREANRLLGLIFSEDQDLTTDKDCETIGWKFLEIEGRELELLGAHFRQVDKLMGPVQAARFMAFQVQSSLHFKVRIPTGTATSDR